MKKFLFSVSLVATLAVHAEVESYMYWMVGSDVTGYDEVKVAAVDSSWGVNYLNLYTENFAQLDGVSADQVGAANEWGAGFLAGLGSYASSTYTFYVELWNDGAVVSHTTGGKTWDDIQSYLVTKNAMSEGAAGTWSTSASGFTAGAIPEPTSGILLLLGVAALGLRRRLRA